MSQQQWPAPTRLPGGGSVRRAREMAEQGIAPEMPSQIPRPLQQQRAFDNPRAAPRAPTNRPRPQVPPAFVSTKSGQGPIGVAISRPTQVPQWPLAATIEGGSDPQYQPPPGRGVPPQRPPRPSHVPSMLDASRLQDPTPSFQYQPQQGRGYEEEEDVISPLVTSPMTQSSRQSTLSSVGSIPDFPVPMPPPGPPRRSANLGPPPSSRRGASSYYSQASFVSPIPEESPRTVPSHQSYASSAAMPTSWGSDSPRYDEDDYEDEEVFDRDSRDYRDEGRGFGSPIEEGRESMKSRESNGDDSDDRGLIRSASFGRRAKPSMITTRSSERVEPTQPQQAPQQSMSKLEKMGVIAGVGGPSQGLTAPKADEGGQRETVWPIIGDVNSPLATGTGLIDKSSTSSEETIPTIARAVTTNEPASAYAANRSEPKATEKEMLGAYNAASSLAPPPAPIRTPSPGFSRLSAIRRPPRLDMDAVRDAEARGSLTSLPDLIRRATRLAAMMDHGKRPGSRLALNDWPSDNGLARDKEMGLSEDEKHKSGLSGMLAAFPPPGIATPTRGGTPVRPVSSWPSAGQYGDLANSSEQPKKKRRCCGLPCWGFILVLLILLVIIAAAVVVPLELLVFHKPSSKLSTTVSALQQCEASSTTACKNGGTSVIDNGSCACICTNGFTGSTCTIANATGCTTTTLSNLANVTLGDSIGRLIADAQTNFSIPLSESTIIARFNNANLTCASENALVTFDGESEREGNANDVVSTGTSTKNKRDTTSSASCSVATSDSGIIYDSSTPSSTASTKTSTSTSSSTTSSASSTATNPLGVFNITEEVLDFARVAVLYILQQEQFDAAVTAQSGLQKFFSLQSFTNMAAANVSLGNGNVVDLLAFTVNAGNGTVGSKNVSSVSNIWIRGQGHS
ncbi:hypothetical protein BDZ45DRAFT_704061 [Acephala macrosclerotiorum]|nr:hypothetical protein BDZ45DRAFT_704061 [Acephala macrosclerotiorum]